MKPLAGKTLFPPSHVPYEQKVVALLKHKSRESFQEMFEKASSLLIRECPTEFKSIKDFASEVSILPQGDFGGQKPEILIVGGFVRDALMGVESRDIDIEVYGVKPALLKATLERIFPDRVEVVGKSYEIIKVRLKSGVELDISIPRRHDNGDKTVGLEAGNPSLSPKEAARLRDFSINNFAMDPISGEVYDFWDGLADIERNTLKITAPDYFINSPLRVMRAVQFCARLHLWPDNESLELMKEMVADNALEKPHKKRITTEFTKLLLKGVQPSIGFELMRTLGVIDRSFPELRELIDTQNNKGSLWSRGLERLDLAAHKLEQGTKIKTEAERVKYMLSALAYDLSDKSIKSLSNRLSYPKSFCTAVITTRLCQASLFELESRLESYTVKENYLKPGRMLPKRSSQLQKNDFSLIEDAKVVINDLYPANWNTAVEVWKLNQPIKLDLVKPYLFCVSQLDSLVRDNRLHENSRSPLIKHSDIVKELKLENGPIIEFIIRLIEKKRSELYTKRNALEYLRNNLDSLVDLTERSIEELSKKEVVSGLGSQQTRRETFRLGRK